MSNLANLAKLEYSTRETEEDALDKRCAGCGQAKDEELFYRSKTKRDGRDVYCKECRNERHQARLVRLRAGRPAPAPLTEKACTKCGTIKALDQFYRGKGRGGRQSWCRVCKDAYHSEYVSQPHVAERLRQVKAAHFDGHRSRPLRPAPTREGYEVCTFCVEEKLLDGFHKHPNGRHGVNSICKECNSMLSRERRKDPALREREARQGTARRYGITVAEYDALLLRTGGHCEICGRKPSERKAHVDHNHETGVVRGLLCYNCNSAIGWLKDDPALLRSATAYLERTKGNLNG